MAGGRPQLEEEEESRRRGFTSGTAREGVSWRRSSSLRQSMFSKLEDATREGMQGEQQDTRTRTRARAHTHARILHIL